MGQITIERIVKGGLPRIQSQWAKHHKQQASFGVITREIGDQWLNLFGLHVAPQVGQVYEIGPIGKDEYAGKDGTNKVSLWADVQSGAVGAPPPIPVKLPDLGPSPYSTGAPIKPLVSEIKGQPLPIGNLFPPIKPVDTRTPWNDIDRLIDLVHAKACQLEPDKGVMDRASARVAMVDTLVIALTSKQSNGVILPVEKSDADDAPDWRNGLPPPNDDGMPHDWPDMGRDYFCPIHKMSAAKRFDNTYGCQVCDDEQIPF